MNPESASKGHKKTHTSVTYDNSDDSDSDYIDENAFGGFNINFTNFKAIKEVQLGKYDP